MAEGWLAVAIIGIFLAVIFLFNLISFKRLD